MRTTRLYISSLAFLASHEGPILRIHWAIENGPHWVLDMIFRDDECRIRTDHAPTNFATIRHMTRKLCGKDFMRVRRKVAAWVDQVLVCLITARNLFPIPAG